MAFCPQCRSEYREGIARCVHCELELVPALPESDEGKSERLREAVVAGEAAPIVRASYAEACQVVEVLHASGVDAMVTADKSSCGAHGSCSHYFVTILREDGERALEVLRADFKRLLEDEGAAAAVDGVVDLDADGPHACPACGASFDGQPEECPACGLFLGAA